MPILDSGNEIYVCKDERYIPGVSKEENTSKGILDMIINYVKRN